MTPPPDRPKDAPGLWRALSQALMDSSPGLLIAVDQWGHILSISPRAADRFGLRAGTPFKQSLPTLWLPVRDVLSDGRPRSEVSFRIDGTDHLAAVIPVITNQRIAAAIIRLGSRQPAATVERQLRFLREMARERDAIIDSSSDGLFVCDSEATVIRVNPASERIHNIDAEQLVGKNMVDLIRQGFIDRSAAMEAIDSKSTVSLLQSKDNRKLISTGTPVFDDAGKLIRVVVSERDITQIDHLQRRLEAQQALKDHLQQQLAEIQQRTLKSKKIIVRSPSMVKTLRQALKVSTADSSVLISGESGVGKGLVANLIHKNSARAEESLIRINCGAIPESLVESELFGYEKGAFTGAQEAGKPGYLELADGGTLFLDEIAELPPPAQVKLLRFLEDGRITRLGGTRNRHVNARIVAATHRDLKQMVDEGSFRNDLYYRLNVIPLQVPPVRERKACLLPLLRYYIDDFAKKAGCDKRLSHAAIDALMAYPFPGNVRELINICERAVVMSETEVIDLSDLPKDVVNRTGQLHQPSIEWPPQISLEQILQSVERSLLLDSMQKHNGQAQIAKALGVSQPTVARRMKKYGLRPSVVIRDS